MDEYSWFLSPKPVKVTVLVDSGADADFMDEKLVRRLHIPVGQFSQLLRIWTIDKYLVCRSNKVSKPITLHIDNHYDNRLFYVICSASRPIILGITWLRAHRSIG